MNKKTSDKKIQFDVAVIGGGPSGMMAAARAAELGSRVVLIEKNQTLGNKLLLTGKGRCNLTRAENNLKDFADSFGKQGRFLSSGLSVFGTKDTINFFESHGLKTKIERGKRVFPVTDKARDVLNVLENCLKQGNVVVLKGRKVKTLEKSENKITNIVLEGGKRIIAYNYIICTGGKSYPSTGSTGDGYAWTKKLGHTIIMPAPALTPLKIKEKWTSKLQGLSLKNVEISVWQNNKKKDERFGEALFTHFGISGPIILGMSKNIGKLFKNGEVKLHLDLKPGLDEGKLDRRLQRDFEKYQNKFFKNALDDLLPRKLIPLIIKLSGIHPNKETNSITRQERQQLVCLLKQIKITVKGLVGFEKAIITTGGVDLKEIDSRTMKSKIINNLYLAGEIINLDGPSGGYNLQLCWTTGYLAGQSAATR